MMHSLFSFVVRTNKHARGFTLIETFVAITILTVSVAAPLSLASQSLHSAQYVKDQIIAFNLAQEAIEVVRARRDKNLLEIAKNGSSVSWYDGIPVDTDLNTTPNIFFTVDGISGAMNTCSGSCSLLIFDAATGFYGYGNSGTATKFTRTVSAQLRNTPTLDQMVVRAVVTWRSGVLGGPRQVTIEEEMYQWVTLDQ